MGFLDKLSGVGSAISSKSQEAANKAKEMSGVSSLKSKISTAEGSIRVVYAELGEKMFEEKGDWVAENFPELMEKVSELKANIEQYNQDIENLKQATADANAKLQEDEKARKAAAAQLAAEKAAAKAEEAEAAARAKAEAEGARVTAAAEAAKAKMAAEAEAANVEAVNAEAAGVVVEAVEEAVAEAAQDVTE